MRRNIYAGEKLSSPLGGRFWFLRNTLQGRPGANGHFASSKFLWICSDHSTFHVSNIPALKVAKTKMSPSYPPTIWIWHFERLFKTVTVDQNLLLKRLWGEMWLTWYLSASWKNWWVVRNECIYKLATIRTSLRSTLLFVSVNLKSNDHFIF